MPLSNRPRFNLTQAQFRLAISPVHALRLLQRDLEALDQHFYDRSGNLLSVHPFIAWCRYAYLHGSKPKTHSNLQCQAKPSLPLEIVYCCRQAQRADGKIMNACLHERISAALLCDPHNPSNLKMLSEDLVRRFGSPSPGIVTSTRMICADVLRAIQGRPPEVSYSSFNFVCNLVFHCILEDLHSEHYFKTVRLEELKTSVSKIQATV